MKDSASNTQYLPGIRHFFVFVLKMFVEIKWYNVCKNALKDVKHAINVIILSYNPLLLVHAIIY